MGLSWGGGAGPGFWCHTYVAVTGSLIQANSISYISRMLY